MVAVWQFGTAVDVVIVTPEDVDRYRDTHCLVICPALREGKVVYERKRFPPDDPVNGSTGPRAI